VRSQHEKWEREAATQSVEVAATPIGHGLVETFTVEHVGDAASSTGSKPTRAIFVGIMLDGDDKGKRFLAVSDISEVIAFMVDPCRTTGGGFATEGWVHQEPAGTVFTPQGIYPTGARL
jgi:hypothetical protein